MAKRKKNLGLPKMKTVNFPYTIDSETTKQFLNEMEEALAEGANINIYINSEGGEVAPAHYLALMLNTYLSEYPQRIAVFTGPIIASAALMFLEETGLPIYVGPHTIGLVHRPTVPLDYRSYETKHTLSNGMKNELEESSKMFMERWKELYELTEEEIAILERGDDILISNERMKKCFSSLEMIVGGSDGDPVHKDK